MVSVSPACEPYPVQQQCPELPSGLPEPIDDGGAAHLAGALVPDLSLPSTAGGLVDLRDLAARPGVLQKVRCPVFPPDENATVLGWLTGARGPFAATGARA